MEKRNKTAKTETGCFILSYLIESEKKKKWRKEYNKKYYSKNKNHYRQKAKNRFRHLKNDPDFLLKIRETSKKWEKKNYNKRKIYFKLYGRLNRKRQIKEHKWYCRIHKIQIGENYYCPEYKIEMKQIKQ